MPTVRRDEMLCISEPEVMTLAATFEHAAYQTMIRLTVFGGGLRAAEVAGLVVADFDPVASSIRVARARRRGEYVDTKTEAGRRTNVLPSWLAAEVAELCTGRADDEPMFLSPDGAAHDHGNFMRRTFKPTVMRVGLPKSFRFHDLRHTAASLALAKGVPVVDVARWLGHANPTTTLSVYAHVIPDQRGRPAAAFENVARPTLRAVS